MLKVFVTCACIFITACGRYGPPLPPEVLAPKAVSGLHVQGEEAGIKFAWTAPRVDQRGKELKSLDGYRLYRKVLVRPSDATNKDVKFLLLATIEDHHVDLREEKRREARAQGKPVRRIQAPTNATKFEYSDRAVVRGITYLYKLVPFNQEDVESVTPSITTVSFDGANSQITLGADTSSSGQSGSMFDEL